MSLRNLLETNFPYGTNEASPEQLTQGLSVSNEGLGDILKKVFSRKKDDDTPKRDTNAAIKESISNFDWVEENLVKGDPTKLNFKEEGTVTLGPRHAPFFYRDNSQVSDIAKEVTKDLAIYQSIFSKYQGPVKRNNQNVMKIDKEASDFLKRDKHPEGLEEFTKLMVKWEAYITPLNAGFRDPNVSFLAYGKQSFLKDGLFADHADQAKPISKDTVELPVVTSATIRPLIDIIGKLWVLQEKCEELNEDGGLGLDITDPPFRGYYREVFEKQPNLLILYTHPNLESVSSYLIEQITYRIDFLVGALIAYIRNSTV